MKAIGIVGSPRLKGNTYWNVAVGREKGEVEKDEEGMETAWNFGKNIAFLVKKLYHPSA